MDYDRNPYVVAAFVCYDCGVSFVDKNELGGFFVNTGVIISLGIDMHVYNYLYHPVFRKRFLGQTIYRGENLVALGIDAASFISGLRFIGCDLGAL